MNKRTLLNSVMKAHLYWHASKYHQFFATCFVSSTDLFCPWQPSWTWTSACLLASSFMFSATILSSVLGPLHTRDWEPVTITFQALSLVDKMKLVQVRFTLRLRDQRTMWMQEDGCKDYMDSHSASNASCFMVTWTILKNHLLGGRPNTKPMGDHDTPNAHNRWFILFYHVWESAWIEILLK